MITRRNMLIALGAGTLSPTVGVLAQQQTKTWHIGFLTPRSRPAPPGHDAFSDAFMQGMRDLGYSEGKNLVVEWRYADGDYKRLAGFAVELVGMDLPVIVAYGTAAARALQGTTKTVPIVVAAAVDLVGAGIAASLARPGGNITGLSAIDVDLSEKHLELLKAASPALSRVAVLLNPGNPADPAVLKHVQAVAPAFGVEVLAVNASTPQAIESGFAAVAQEGAGGVIIAADAVFSGQGSRLAAAALQHRLATIGIYQDHVVAGCLMSYGPNIAEFHRQAARYVDKILKGARPEDLPVEQPTKIDLVINSVTATRLGLTLPRELLALTDQVIE
jgi:putative tryptophan/tyrosine transport system substrate-binding protein